MKQAVFVVVQLPSGNFAATTRAADRGEAGKIGLPGGKVDPGETLVDAALRESTEEGWAVSGIDSQPYYTAQVDEFEVFWFRAKTAVALDTYKEQHRIQAISASYAALAMSGFGNDIAMENLK